MDDWKARIDAWAADNQRQAAARAQRRDTLVAQVATDAPQPARHSHRWGKDRTLAAHQRRFRCHVCHKPSDGPRTFSTVRLAWISRTADDEGPHKGVQYVQHVDWECPTGLERCRRCHAWSCAEHLHMTICQPCAGRLRPSS